MSPETKHVLLYGAVIVGGVGVALWLYNRSGNNSAAQAQADALAQEQNLAALAYLGTGGTSLSTPSVSAIQAGSFSQELTSILNAAGLGAATEATSNSNTTLPGTGFTPVAPITYQRPSVGSLVGNPLPTTVS